MELDYINGIVYQCGGSGSVESVSFPWIRIRIKNWLDAESGLGSVSNDMDPDPTTTIRPENNFYFLSLIKMIIYRKLRVK